MGAPVLLLLTPQNQPAFRAGVSVVRVDADVRDGRGMVEGLTLDDFRVTDNGRPQKILHVGHSEEPLDLMLLFDTSGSMMPAVRQVSDIARLALDELRPGDRAAVMAFDADTVLVADFTSDFAAVDSSRDRGGGARSVPAGTEVGRQKHAVGDGGGPPTACQPGRRCYLSPGSRPSEGAPVPDDPTNSLRPSGSVMSRPFARFDPFLAR